MGGGREGETKRERVQAGNELVVRDPMHLHGEARWLHALRPLKLGDVYPTARLEQ